MSWRQPTIDDLKATLSDLETQVFGEASFDDAALSRQLANSVSSVRGFVRSGRKCRMPSDESLLPDFLISPTMDYAAFNVLKRLRIPVGESRTKAYDRACALFEKVGAGQIVPEDFGEDAADVAPDQVSPMPHFKRRHRLLGRLQEEGV